MTLSELRPGEKGIIKQVNHINPSMISRMISLGLIPGEAIEVLRQAPLGDPIQIRAGATTISVRRADSTFIELIRS